MDFLLILRKGLFHYYNISYIIYYILYYILYIIYYIIYLIMISELILIFFSFIFFFGLILMSFNLKSVLIFLIIHFLAQI